MYKTHSWIEHWKPVKRWMSEQLFEEFYSERLFSRPPFFRLSPFYSARSWIVRGSAESHNAEKAWCGVLLLFSIVKLKPATRYCLQKKFKNSMKLGKTSESCKFTVETISSMLFIIKIKKKLVLHLLLLFWANFGQEIRLFFLSFMNKNIS